MTLIPGKNKPAAVLLLQIICSGFFNNLPAGDFGYYLDYSTFKAGQGFKYIEIYFAIPRSVFEYTWFENKYKARMKFTVDVFANDSLLSSQSWENQSELDSLGAIEPGELVHEIYGLYLKEGQYRLMTKISDLVSNNEKEKAVDMEIKLPSANRLSLSDIQLAIQVTRDDNKNNFVKNGYHILPNPRGVYDNLTPVLYYYLEIYQLSSLVSSSDSTYTVKTHIQDDNGIAVCQLPPKSKLRKAVSLVELGQVYVGALASGFYKLFVEVIDNACQDTARCQKAFYIYRPQDMVKTGGPSESGAGSAEFMEMDEQTLDQHFKYAYYLVTPEEKKSFKQLILAGKRTFLQNFWRNRDEDPLTPENDFQATYYNRIHIANQLYTSPSKNGWQTDRGRVIVLYGQPDDLERHTQPTAWKRAYEIWRYFRLQGGVEFIFSDESGYGDFKLVHSTALNEIHDNQWEDKR